MNWLGHLMRLKEETPARKALFEALKIEKRKVGRPPTTWLKLIEKDLEAVNIRLNTNHANPEEIIDILVELTEDRKKWSKMIRDIMVGNH